MTIKEYAAQHKISPQAVYQRVKKNKIKIESLTEKGSGELTAEGIVILDKLFDPENRQTKPAKDELIEAMEQQISTFRELLASKEERLKSLETEVETLREDKEYFKQALDKAQNNLTAVKNLLAGDPPQKQEPEPARSIEARRKLTLRERFTGRLDSSSKG